MTTKLEQCRQDLETALTELTLERDRMQELAERYERSLRQVEVEHRRAEDARTHSKRVFERKDFEAMTREQLVSLTEGAINEARRKGLIEAEGLASRQLKLAKETDLDLMRGVVKEYQSRIAEVEAELALTERVKNEAKVDTRPLSAKLETAQPAVFKAPTWWDVATPVAKTIEAAQVGFIPFDQRASAITAAAKAKQPHELQDGASVVVPGATGGHYILERHGNVYSCTCPAWRYNRETPERRTCKHLETYLGEGVEGARITAYLKAKCHCGNPLVRGQCPTHTRNWKGPEKCACGRSFASCKAAYDTISVAQRRFGHQPALTTVDGRTYVYATK